MAVKINWQEPDDDNITKVEISRSSTRNGTYTVIESDLDATSDGQPKSSSNTWVTSYIDTNGQKTDWYKIRFYDGTNSVWTDYSDPVAFSEAVSLCTVDDVRKVIDTVGKFTDDEIFEVIQEVESDIYFEYGSPLAAIESYTGSDGTNYYNTYYVGEEHVYHVDRVFYGTTTKQEYYLDDGYKVNTTFGMVKLLSVASGGPELTSDGVVEIRYIPKIFHRLAVYKAAKWLLDKTDYLTDGKATARNNMITKRLNDIENRIGMRYGVMFGSQYTNYDPVYGVNKKLLQQDHDRNLYLASQCWD